MTTISFSELIKDSDSTVRVTDDGLLYAVDLVIVVTGSSRDNAGHAIRTIPEHIFPQVCFLTNPVKEALSNILIYFNRKNLSRE